MRVNSTGRRRCAAVLELSRNAMTARVAYEMGPERVLQYGRRLGIYGDSTPAVFALALGAGETTLMRMTTAYGMFVNGGRRIQPDHHRPDPGSHRPHPCSAATSANAPTATPNGAAASARRTLPDTRQQVLDPVTAYQIVSMSEGVVQRGTATVVGTLGVPARRQDRHHQRLQGRVVHRLFAGPRRRRVGRLRYAAQHGRRRNRRPHRGADLPRLHARSAARCARRRRSGFPPACVWCASTTMTGLLPVRRRRRRSWKRSAPTPSRRADVPASPFVFGGTDPIDPRVLVRAGRSDGRRARATASARRQRSSRNSRSARTANWADLY